jgi:hypothetical protein
MRSDLLTPILENELIHVDFLGNALISALFKRGSKDGVPSLEELMEIIDEVENNVLKVEAFSTVEDFLEFIYTGNIKNITNATELHELACKYDISALKSLIRLKLSVSNEFENHFKSLEFLHNCASAFDELWTSKGYTDFIIFAGADNPFEFPVRKSVLASYSSVFTAALDHDMKEKHLGE